MSLFNQRGAGIAARYSSIAVAATLFASAAYTQAPENAVEGSSPPEKIAADVFMLPVLKHIDVFYPLNELQQNGEGWVVVAMMVDQNGKPYEVAVDSSSGSKVFEEAAVKAVENATYAPALENGVPVESTTKLKIHYDEQKPYPAAKHEFAVAYSDLVKAVKTKDRVAADAAMKRMIARNLYEDAYAGLAAYQYARVWGNEAQQRDGLKRAIAGEAHAQYLSKEDFASAEIQCLVLDVRLHDYADAIKLWGMIQNNGIDPATFSKLQPMMQAVDAIRTSSASYDVAGQLPHGTWQMGLLKQRFRISVDKGQISDIKLRCKAGFLRFAYRADFEYNISGKYSGCYIQLDGDPGTSITLTQL